jgi:hypothetical protein
MLHRIISLLLIVSYLQPQMLKGNEHDQPYHLLQGLKPSIYAKIAQELPAASDEYIADTQQQPLDADKNDQLTDNQKRSIILKLFGEYSLANFHSSASTISTDDIRKDLEFFNQASLYNHVKRTSTVFGDVVLARRLAEPTANSAELRRRQNIVHKLIEDDTLFEALDTALTEIKKAEPIMLSFFSQQNELRQQALNSLYFDKMLWGGFPGYSDEWDKNEKLLFATEVFQKGWLVWGLATFAARTKIALDTVNAKMLTTAWAMVALLRFKPEIFQKMVVPAAMVVLGVLIYRYVRRDQMPDYAALGNQPRPRAGIFTHEDIAGQPQAPGNGAAAGNNDGLWARLKQGFDRFTGLQRTLSTFEMAALLPLALYNEVKVIYVWQIGVAYLQKRLMHLAASVRKMRSISASLFQHKELMGMIPEALPLVHLFQHGDGSDDMQKLLAMLESKTFKGNVSIRSHFGRIAATNKLMNATKYDWVEIFEAIGYLDVYLSTAKVMKEFKNKKVPYCFAQYLTADTPKLALENFWDPLLDAEHAVPNTISLGDPTRNILLTGPNTGGKSTVIKGIMLATLCAQTLGIVPAQACSLTPFAAFNTYSRVEDDIEHELSLFAAEVKRANHLKQKIKNLPKGEFGLTIIDEMFRGTAPDNAEQLSYQYAIDFGNCSNSMCLMATHYPKLIDLEKATQEKYHNYKVEIEKLPDGTLKRNYKLVRGSTTQNVALDILKEQGLI